MFKRKQLLSATLSIIFSLGSTLIARAEKVEVFTSLSVTKHTFDVPLNEQPFYGFMPKSEVMLAADRKFIDAVEKNTGREVGAEQFEAMGWNAVRTGDFVIAGKRFNQAWLLDPGRSSTVHGLAIVTANRFGDFDYAIELASAAANLRHPLPALLGDQGGFLLKAGRPDQAVPVLEKATIALPNWINPHLNLATARLDLGDARGACQSLSNVARLLQEQTTISPNIDTLYRSLNGRAKCNTM